MTNMSFIVASAVGVVLGLCILWFLANEFYSVANEKGYYDKRYFWICFFFGVAGYLLVIALPNHKNIDTRLAADDELPPI